MPEYIEREALVHHFMTKRQYLTKDVVLDAAYEISRFPKASVAEVVRCKDCKHYRKFKGRSMCAKNAKLLDGHEVHLTATGEDEFCSRGERSGTQPQKEASK